MEQKSKECKSSVMPYIAIVAIVAVVAVVILVMNGGSSKVSVSDVSDESALAGEAPRVICSRANLVGTCRTQADCTRVGGYWHSNSTCTSYPPPPSVKLTKTFSFETSVPHIAAQTAGALISVNGVSNEFTPSFQTLPNGSIVYVWPSPFSYDGSRSEVTYGNSERYNNGESRLTYNFRRGCSSNYYVTWNTYNGAFNLGLQPSNPSSVGSYISFSTKGEKLTLSNGHEVEFVSGGSNEFNFILRCD